MDRLFDIRISDFKAGPCLGLLFASIAWSAIASAAIAAPVELAIEGPGGEAAMPVSAGFELGANMDPLRLAVVELKHGAPDGAPIPAQCDAGRLSWLLPAGPARQRRFRVIQTDAPHQRLMSWRVDKERQYYSAMDGQALALRYNFGVVPLPSGRERKKFADGRQYGGDRSDYIQPLYGLQGEVLTEDFPADHPHHRGLWWSWPVVRWNDRVADIWAVCDIWSRPQVMRRVDSGPVMAILEAENHWKFGEGEKEKPVVRETVVIRAYRAAPSGRFLDVDLALEAIAHGVAIGGRPGGGYGGFSLRAAPGADQQIAAHEDPIGHQPRRAWVDYAARFDGAKPHTGITIIESVDNPGYPNRVLSYPKINCVMPAFPGDREIPLKKGQPIVLRHRIWIHPNAGAPQMIAPVWDGYNRRAE